jgi:hypothetical protein
MTAAYSSLPANGEIRGIQYVPDGTNPLATGAVVTVTGETTGIPVITITGIGTVAATFAPRVATCSIANAASLYAAAGTAVTDRIALGPERLKVTISSGGATKVGTLYFVIG